MGFSNGQEKGLHEAIIVRQENEIRLIETMRRCLIHRVKCERDYATSLSHNVVHIGLKIERTEELFGNLIFKMWKKFMEDNEQQSKLIRSNADQLELLCTGRILQLHQDKKKFKRIYQEEHSKLSSRISYLTEEVSRKKTDYQKNMEYYKHLRMRFEEHYVKSGRVGRKLDEMRDKYQKACRKLHLAHNDYVLLTNEAIEFEKDYRSTLLPNLLDGHKKQQEFFLNQWKDILLDAAKCIDSTSEMYCDIKKRIFNNFDDGQNFAEEYQDYSEKDASKLPTIFSFDDQLIEDAIGKLQPNQLTVDNLTVESLRIRMSELEISIKECQDKQKSEANVSEITSEKTLEQNKKTVIGLNQKNAVLRCEERQKSKLLDIIRSALNDVSCEELPSGCDDLADLDTHKNDSNHETKSSSMSEIIRKSDLLSSMKKPFKRWKSNSTNQISISLNTPSSNRASTARSSAGESMIAIAKNRPLSEEEWFHGVLPREEVVRLLRNEGDFLVRETMRNDENQIVLSVCWNGHKHFIVQTTSEGHYRFEGPAFDTIQELILHQYQSESPVTSRSGTIITKPVLRERWELNNDDVVLLEKIGRGNFGDVYKAKLKTSKQNVAVKTCKQTLPEEQKRKFLQEGRILKQYDHPNIVKLIGICVQKQPIMIVMELVEGGSLLMFLRKNAGALTLKEMLAMCKDTSDGMKYLESKNCIHRDLAARNCLIGNENIVKISDFGMSREEEEYIVSDGMKQIPIKWTAPEALNFGKYNSLCDVWSYAVLVWEIFSKGGTPYAGLSNAKAREKIEEGFRMPCPEGTPQEIYDLMLKCWKVNPDDRPHFDEIFDIIDSLIAKLSNEDTNV